MLANKRDELLAKQPPYDALMSVVVDAWQMLDSTRAIGMAVGPIPVTAVWTYCERKQFDDELTNAITTAINHLDVDRRKREASRRNTQTKTNPRSK